MINKIKKFFKYRTVKYGDSIVANISKKKCSEFKNGKKIYLSNEVFIDKDLKLGFIPYAEDQIPDMIKINKKTNQIEEIVYFIDGSGHIERLDITKPSHIFINNGKIIKERYGRFISGNGEKSHYSRKNGKSKFGITPYTVPSTVIYEDDGSINKKESFWMFHLLNSYNTDKYNESVEKSISFENYMQILSNIKMNPINYKNWTQKEKILVSIYMDIKAYKDVFKLLDIECSMEGFIKNKEIFEMYYD